MSDFADIGRLLLLIGLAIAGLGLLFMISGRLPFLGRLPGDIYIQRDNLSCWFPLATSLVLSILLSLLLTLISLLRR
ncbi:MAG: DUF2905 domain-containing protein [Chloroflexi bacterium]|nr:DUF2905 domain-containing protein [Chloroflexota bacterium]